MKFNYNQPIPLLFLGDAPDSPTGLGRVGQDLAWLASSMPEFQVGYLGRGSFGRSICPWTQYSFPPSEQWGENLLERAWSDLAGDRRGIIMTVWDASRLLWFADGRNTGLEGFLRSGRFERWGYFMADASGVHPDKLPLEQSHVLSRYQRVVMASKWAGWLADEIKGPEKDWLPHLINRDVFKPADPTYGRSAWGLGPRDVVIGCVMSNQARKHWPTVMAALAMMQGSPYLWIHTDTLLGYWNIQALAVEYGIAGRVICEDRDLSDKELAMRYSACNATVVISGGEGFCYPVAESLSCGTPAIVGSYGAQAELTHWHVRPVITVIETSHNVRRAIYSPGDVAECLREVIASAPSVEKCTEAVVHLDGPKMGPLWKKWFRRGL